MKIFQLFGEILVKDEEAQKSLQKTDKSVSKLASNFGKGIGTAAKWGAGLVGAAAGAATAVVGALLKMDEATKEYRENQAKLATAWQAAGKDAETAKQAYDGLYRVIGDQDTATEAGQLLASLAQDTEDVAKWTEIAAGVSGTFGDSLPINSLIEAANETQKTGQITGALADALNWAGVSEEAFQEKLDGLSTEQERNALITETLSGLYSDAATAFEENNAQTLAARDAQLQLDEAMAKLGGAVEETKTALMAEFAPSIANIVSSFVDFTKGVEGADIALQQSIEDMVTKIAEKLPEFIDFGIDIIVSIAKGIVKNLPYLLKKLPEIIGSLVDGLKELGKELGPVGKELISILWDGLKSAWKSVSDWIGEKVEWLADKLFFWRSGKNEMQEFATPDGSHASGLAYVPYDGYKAILHRGETILNANDAQGIKDMLKAFMNNQIATNGGMPTRLEIPLYINGREFYRASIDDLRSVAKSNPEVLSKI